MRVELNVNGFLVFFYRYYLKEFIEFIVIESSKPLHNVSFVCDWTGEECNDTWSAIKKA